MASKQNIIIKQITVKDIELLRKLSIATFTDTFAAYNREENMRMYIEKYFSPENLQDELNDGDNFFFVAFYKDEPAGYLKLRIPQEHRQLLIQQSYLNCLFHFTQQFKCSFRKFFINVKHNITDIFICFQILTNNVNVVIRKLCVDCA
jgi:hypothetical protein